MSQNPSDVPRSDSGDPVRPVEDVAPRMDNSRRCSIVSGRNVGWAILLLFGALVLSFWLNVVRPVLQHNRTVSRIEDVMRSLEERCPDDVPEEDWYPTVAWTWNATVNCLTNRAFLIKREGVDAEFSRFVDELELRAQGDVGPEFFEFFWDELERLSVNGERYSQNYRPVKDGRFVPDKGLGRAFPQSQ